MRKNKLLSLLLAMTMLLSMVPVAHAADPVFLCEHCKRACEYTVLKEANCQEGGVVKYVCVNESCTMCINKVEVLKETEKDPANHKDTICVDNEDGYTHDATCPYCPAYKNVEEPHEFVNGFCTKCRAMDYSVVEIKMPKSMEVYVGLDDFDAAISVGDVALKAGNVDVTEDYTLTYVWMSQDGKIVGNSATYALPRDVVSKEGDYTYGCMVMATPKDPTLGKYINASCTVTVRVRDLIVATATVNADGKIFTMDATNTRTEISIMDQIYDAAYDLTKGYPSYVVFGEKPETEVGDLKIMEFAYYFAPANNLQTDLADLMFVPSENKSGSYVITFNVVDTSGDSYPGVLTIIVERNIGFVDLVYTTTVETGVNFDSEDFSDFWKETYDKGELLMVWFEDLPATRAGTLYYDYSERLGTGDKVVADKEFYNKDQNILSGELIDDVTFLPYRGFAGTVTIPFTAYGRNNRGIYETMEGSIIIFISEHGVEEVAYTMTGGTAVTLDGNDFLEIYRTVTGSRANNFSIKILDLPETGALYVDYTGTVRDRALTKDTLEDYTFHYDSEVGVEIGDLTYVGAKVKKTTTETLRYVAYDTKGEFAFVGEIDLINKAATVVYTKYFSDVPKTSATEYYYTAVMELAEAGIINGIDDTHFGPDMEVNYGMALKLILLAAGYPVPAQTGTHWASGYLSLAQAEGIISTNITEKHLDNKITRNMIASIAAQAMGLPETTLTESPFADVPMTSPYAKYVLALYEAGIITGSTNLKGEKVYYGVNSILRRDIAVIIWRIYEFRK